MKFPGFILICWFGIIFKGSICFPEPRSNVRLSDLQIQIDDIRSELDGKVVNKREVLETFFKMFAGLVGHNEKESTKQDTLVILNGATLQRDIGDKQRQFTIDKAYERGTLNEYATQFRNTTAQMNNDLLMELKNIEDIYSQSSESEGKHLALKNATMQVRRLLQNITSSIDTFTSLATTYGSKLYSEKSLSQNGCNTRETGNEWENAPKSCQDVTKSGVHTIYPDFKPSGLELYCEIDQGKVWVVIQRRKYGTVDFDRSWEEYKNGFGNLTGDFWLGNEYIYHMTKYQARQLRIDMETFDGKKRYAMYNEFGVSSEEGKYRLKADVYSGDAGDAFNYSAMKHNGQMFSTYDADNDISSSSCCSCSYKSGWWFSDCLYSNLNGMYYYKHEIVPDARGITWYTLSTSRSVMKFAEMKIH
ncbi:techylectin-5B-like [Dreissena polymorpha]|uniref:Fibrinogen C-terminal domain-containing protein n=1 Tax=Dreissena polymorpha TaxID=45954 RepID=A0A9D4DMH3_DREPO|nr:techylectin-5B-like [Dreissena polymorpha]KAH3751638.1 hypothetical protein DPMN_186206 [Dreissena polymorpha]